MTPRKRPIPGAWARLGGVGADLPGWRDAKLKTRLMGGNRYRNRSSVERRYPHALHTRRRRMAYADGRVSMTAVLPPHCGQARPEVVTPGVGAGFSSALGMGNVLFPPGLVMTAAGADALPAGVIAGNPIGDDSGGGAAFRTRNFRFHAQTLPAAAFAIARSPAFTWSGRSGQSVESSAKSVGSVGCDLGCATVPWPVRTIFEFMQPFTFSADASFAAQPPEL